MSSGGPSKPQPPAEGEAGGELHEEELDDVAGGLVEITGHEISGHELSITGHELSITGHELTHGVNTPAKPGRFK